MYRVFLFLTCLAYCSSLPLNNSPLRNADLEEQHDDIGYVRVGGTGYDFFRRQDIDGRPSNQPVATMSDEDLYGYKYASAFKQPPQTHVIENNRLSDDDYGQKKYPLRPNPPVQQPASREKDRSQLRPSNEQNLRRQRPRPKNVFGNQQQQPPQDSRFTGPQQMTYPQNNLNFQQKPFNGYGNQQQDHSFSRQPQPTRNTQQKPAGFGSPYDIQGQQSRFPYNRNQ